MESLTYSYFYLGLFLGAVLFLISLLLLRKLIQNQVQEQIDEFFTQARIPKSFRAFINVRVKWKGFLDQGEN
tara:strand:- start:1509 stop:1724 length:216 start_codon:yes stop_codon:yes gene_type:complete